jgi:RimJ/RimL family protein N-acetyltransferase
VGRTPWAVDARRLAGTRGWLGNHSRVLGERLCPEGSEAATDWAFHNLGWTEVIHSIDPANVASQAVARKLGSRNRGAGALPPPFEHARVDIWGQSREEWRRRERRPTVGKDASATPEG